MQVLYTQITYKKASAKCLLALIFLLFISHTYAQKTEMQPALSEMDLIEMLGELNADDEESLEAALSEVEIKAEDKTQIKTDTKTEIKSNTATTHPKEVKK